MARLREPRRAVAQPRSRPTPAAASLWLASRGLFGYSLICFPYCVASTFRLVLKGKTLHSTFLKRGRSTFYTRGTGSFHSCFMSHEESIRNPPPIKNRAGCCFPSETAIFPAETNWELSLAQQKWGKSPRKKVSNILG